MRTSHTYTALVRPTPASLRFSSRCYYGRGRQSRRRRLLCTKDGQHWFSEIWSMSDVRALWPQLRKDAQKYIACSGTLAQLALQMARSQVLVLRHAQASDNTPTLLHGLSLFLRPIASRSHAHSVALLVSHVSGQKNVWADELSRDKLDRFRSKPLALTLSQSASPKA